MTKSMDAQTLMLGVAREIINPPMEGREVVYPIATPVPTQGVESDMCVRVMVFGAVGDDCPQAALAVLDTLYIHPEFAADIRAAAARELPGLAPDAIMIAATHTHSAPPLRDFDMVSRSWTFKLNGTKSEPLNTSDMSRGWAGRVAFRKIGETGTVAKADPEHVAQAKSAAVKAIVQAWKSRKKVIAGVGRAEARLAHNRRVVDESGIAANVWNDIEGLHTGFCDPNVRFVVFRDAADNHIHAILSGYGCHPVTLGMKNAKPSPDFVGYMVRKLEAQTGATLAMNFNAGGGDINPRNGLGNISLSKQMGEELADLVLASLNLTLPLNPAPIRTATANMELRVRPVAGAGPAELLPGHETSPDQKSVRTHVQAIRIGDLALVSAPGELFQQLVIAAENLSPLPHTMVVGHANDALGYLFTETAGREGGYEVLSGAVTDSAERPYLAAALESLKKVAANT